MSAAAAAAATAAAAAAVAECSHHSSSSSSSRRATQEEQEDDRPGAPPPHATAAAGASSSSAAATATAAAAAARPGISWKELQRCGTTREAYEARRAEHSAARSALSAQLADPGVPGPEKQRLRCAYAVQWGRTLFQCPGCWLLPSHCVCGRLRRVHTRTRVVLWLHHTEWGKGSNSGCVAHASLPNSHMWMRGHEPHDAALAALLADPAATTCALLWPGPGALTPAQLAARAAERSGGHVTLVALDATWSNANRLRASFPDPDVPLLALGADAALAPGASRSLFAPVRKYVAAGPAYKGRVCTLEAVAAALCALEEEGGGAGGASTRDALLHNLKLKVDHSRRQKNMSAVYYTDGDEGDEGRDGEGDGDAAAAAVDPV